MAAPGKARSKSRVDWAARASVGLTALLFAGIGAGLAWGYGPMELQVGSAVSKPVRVEFEWPPLAATPHPKGSSKTMPPAGDPDEPKTWLNEPSQHELVQLAQTMLSEDPFDRNSLRKTSDALMATGWFKKINAVHRRPDGVVRISAQWRAPAAVVRFNRSGTTRDFLVSTEGELLPLEYRPGQSGLKAIINPSYPPPQNHGDKWVGGDVQAGLALLAQLQALPAAFAQTTGVDVSMYVKDRRLDMISDRRTRVVWGASPTDFSPGEPTVKQKLKWLSDLLTSPDFGKRIDGQQALILLTNPRGVMIDHSAKQFPADDGEPIESRDLPQDGLATEGAVSPPGRGVVLVSKPRPPEEPSEDPDDAPAGGGILPRD